MCHPQKTYRVVFLKKIGLCNLNDLKRSTKRMIMSCTLIYILTLVDKRVQLKLAKSFVNDHLGVTNSFFLEAPF